MVKETLRSLFKVFYCGTLLVAFLGILPSMAFCNPSDILEVGKFSSVREDGPFPEGWKPLTFKKIPSHTRYSLVNISNTVVIKAVSHHASSGLTREISIDPNVYPIIQWRWKIENILQKSDITRKSGDDYPARIYITFKYDKEKVGFFERAQFEAIRFLYDQYPPLSAINYIWESHTPVGTMVPNPYTDRVHMIVIESGTEKVGQWVTEERNVFEDYQKIFGEPPPKISGIAIMTDTDNTKESTIAYYGDIVFKKLP